MSRISVEPSGRRSMTNTAHVTRVRVWSTAADRASAIEKQRGFQSRHAGHRAKNGDGGGLKAFAVVFIPALYVKVAVKSIARCSV